VRQRFFLPILFAGLSSCATRPPVGEPAPITSTVDHLLDSLSLRDRVAQVMMPWIPGTYSALDEAGYRQAERWVDSLHVGGIIISVGSPLDEAAKLNALQRRAAIPLLVASDLESGTSIRLHGGTRFPPNMGVAAGGREQDAWDIGRVTALEGRAVGIQMAFAPDADVNSNPANPIINTRSFGEDPARVSAFVTSAVRGIQDNGMLATVKHFPGHGDTETDSHLALPVVSATWARLDTLELVPFRAGIRAGAAAVMSAHIALPGIDSGKIRPATVNPDVLTGVLRDSLSFHGLTVTDALNMQGVVSKYGASEATVLAFEAGADLLLMPANLDSALDAMVAAVRSGRISEARLNRSVRKILVIKQRLGLFQHRLVNLDSVMGTVGRADFAALADSVAMRSIVLARDNGTVDSLRSAPRRLALIQYGEGTSSDVGTTFAAELRSGGDTVTTFRLSAESGPASFDSAAAVLAANPYAIFAAAVRAVAWKGAIGLPAPLTALMDSAAARQPTVLVSFGSPYVIMQSPTTGAYLLAWSSNPESERAAARALRDAAISGRLPISIPPDLPIGTGLTRGAK
jgi:beta-N-acetylhexosaminidase